MAGRGGERVGEERDRFNGGLGVGSGEEKEAEREREEDELSGLGGWPDGEEGVSKGIFEIGR